MHSSPPTLKKEKRRRGKPRNSIVDGIRARVWYAALIQATGAENSNQLENIFFPKNFIPGKNGEDLRTKIFYKYEKGETVPKMRLVNCAEQMYPGTKFWLTLPLWRIIEKKPLSRSELHSLIAQSSPKIASSLDGIKAPTNRKSYNYKSTHSIDCLFRQGDIEALTVLLALIRDGVSKHDHFLIADASTVSIYLSLLVLSREPFYSVRDTLFEYLNNNFFTFRFTKDIYLHANDIDVDSAVHSLRNAFYVAKQNRLKCSSDKEQGRLVYWMWREGFFQSGGCELGAWIDHPHDTWLKANRITVLRQRLSTNELSNPRREFSMLQNIVLDLAIISPDETVKYLNTLRDCRAGLVASDYV